MEHKSVLSESNNLNISEASHGWQKVSYAKKQKKPNKSAGPNNAGSVGSNGSVGPNNVFKKLEKDSEERRKKIEAQRAAAVYDDDGVAVVKRWGDYEDDDVDTDADVAKVEGNVVKKVPEKVKKVKKPKVTVSEAAAKIDADHLAAFLNEITASYESNQDIQLLRFADYFGRAFSAVSAAQFPWQKLFRESPLVKIADVPVNHISEAVFKTSIDWINQHSIDALRSFVLWGLDSILSDLAAQQSGSKASKKVSQQASSKSQVAMFIVISMVLRRKPDVIINVLPELRENSKYQGQDKLPVIVWMIVQASQADLAVGLYAWGHHTLPLLGGKLGSNPQSRDLVLQLIERILSSPKARAILVNGAVRKGERLMPPTALDLLLHVTYPPSSSRVKATERFEAIYLTLKEVALAGAPGSKAMKQVSQQIMAISLKAASEGVSELSREASSLSVWCLSQSPDAYKQWDKLYMDNLEASVKVLKKLSEEWKALSTKQSSAEALAETLKSFQKKNEKALEGGDIARQAVFKDADKYCKVLLGRLSRGLGCLKSLAFFVIVVAAGTAFVSPNVESFDWDKVSLFLSQNSFLKM